MMKNDKLFHRSEIGGKHEYSRWTDVGQQELLEFVLDMSRRMLIVEDIETDKRAKDLVMKNLTGNT
jgi:hypothetical protein